MIRLIFSSPFFLCFFSPLQLELISSLRAKVQALEEDRELVLTEAKQCAERGEELEAAVRAACKPNELERYVMFIGDLEKVVSLLLCLSSRLARVQNAMRKIDGNTDAEEKVSVESTRYLISSVHVCPMGLQDCTRLASHEPCMLVSCTPGLSCRDHPARGCSPGSDHNLCTWGGFLPTGDCSMVIAALES